MSPRRRSSVPDPPHPTGTVDLALLTLSIPADRAGPLREASKLGPDEADPLSLLRHAAAALRRLRSEWLHAAALNAEPCDERTAVATFLHVLQTARAHRSAEAAAAAPAATPFRDAAGVDVALVTLLVASRRDIGAVDGIRDARVIDQLLARLESEERDDFVAVRLLVEPDTGGIRAQDLDRLHPELRRIDAGTKR